VLQCVAPCSHWLILVMCVLWCVAICGGVEQTQTQHLAQVCCSVAEYNSVLQCVAACSHISIFAACVAVHWSDLQCVAVCCCVY